MRVLLACLAYHCCVAQAVCNQGFLVTNPVNASESWIFTEMLESDFTRVKDISKEEDWIRQQFSVSAEAGHGRYAKAFLPSNVVSKPASERAQNLPDQSEQSAGLQLRVDTLAQNGTINSAEIDTARNDFMYGSFRTGMRLTYTKGTCGAFFWYRNNTQEIDIEFLSLEFDREKNIYPVNLVIQSKKSMEANYDAKATGTFKQVNLTFDPTSGFHEYRFDYLPGRVLFFADSTLLAEMKGESVPSSAGHLILQHWSNGNPLWSGGPPEHEAVLVVSYVKAYFNKSASECTAYRDQCNPVSDDADVCVVPDVIASNASTGGIFFSKGIDADSESRAIASRCYDIWVAYVAIFAVHMAYEVITDGW